MKINDIIKKVISGGQSGADRGGLEAAYIMRIKTGGFAPKDFMTEEGPDMSLKEDFLLEETGGGYSFRTKKNVVASDYTIIFHFVPSKGSALTEKYCRELNKNSSVLYSITNQLIFLDVIHFIQTIRNVKGRPIVINIAGNRESVSPGIRKEVKSFMKRVFKRLED